MRQRVKRIVCFTSTRAGSDRPKPSAGRNAATTPWALVCLAGALAGPTTGCSSAPGRESKPDAGEEASRTTPEADAAPDTSRKPSQPDAGEDAPREASKPEADAEDSSSPKCAANQGDPCGSCGGTIQCDGTCSVATPTDYGTSCGSCGGTIQCNGECGVTTPTNYGKACGSCGGTIDCAGTCSVSTPSNYGKACGSCGGTVECNGSCSIATPSDYGKSCGSCGGVIGCDSACSVATPPDYGESCNSCGATYNCSGVCSGLVPSPWTSGDLGTYYLDFNSSYCGYGVAYSWSPSIPSPNSAGTYTCTYTFSGENNLGSSDPVDVLYMGCSGSFVNGYSESALQNGGFPFSGTITCDVGQTVTAWVTTCGESGSCCGDPSINIDVTGCTSTDATCAK